MKQLDLFEDLAPIQQYLHVWSEVERAHRLDKKAPAQGRGENRQMPVGGSVEDDRHQAASLHVCRK